MQGRIRMGMVGGGEGAFIGAVHRRAAALDGEIELVCGAFSSKADNARRTGEALYLPPERVYDNYQQMFAAEAALPAEQRMEFVAIVTPNHLHYPIARLALENGFHVFSEKPATATLQQVLELRDLLREAACSYGLAHTYTGYPLVKEARQRIAAGELGTVRKLIVEYPQGWLAAPEEEGDNRQAAWRLDPAQAGVSCCMGDIGVHAANLAEYVTGLRIAEICADLAAVVPGRELDDDGTVLLRFDNGARGVLIASQICSGEENALKIRVYGDKGGLEWAQHEPNSLWMKWPDRPAEQLRAAASYLGARAAASCRTPPGHPEGYLEAFANLYRDFAAGLRARRRGEVCDAAQDVPGIDQAVRGMAFIEHVVRASREDNKWHVLPDQL